MGSHNLKMELSFILLLIMSEMFSFSSSDTAKDREECAERLAGLATCLPYVGGNAKAPTPDCCNGLKQTLKTNKKCLCVVIMDGNDPNLGITLNVTLAVSLPSVCNAPANISKCPELLHLPPNSKDAQNFYQLGHGSNDSSSSPATSVNYHPEIANNTATTASKKSDGHRQWFGRDVIVAVLFLWCFSSILFP